MFLLKEHGGRSGPVKSGYRGQFFYHDAGDCDALHEYPDCEWAQPWECVRSVIYFYRPELHRGRVRQGMSFLIREGTTTVGFGKVTRILNV